MLKGMESPHLSYRHQRENNMVFCKNREVCPTISSFFTIIYTANLLIELLRTLIW